MGLAAVWASIVVHLWVSAVTQDQILWLRTRRAFSPNGAQKASVPESALRAPKEYVQTFCVGQISFDVLQLSPNPTPMAPPEKWFLPPSPWGHGRTWYIVGNRRWPDSTETIFAMSTESASSSSTAKPYNVSIPLSLPAILSALALLCLSTGGWLLWQDRKRRRWLMGAPAPREVLQ